MTTKQIPIWIDCDTGTDDTVAIMLAHALPELQIVGLSAVAGNSLLCNTFPNTRRVVHLLGADYPVYPGAERPLVREPHVAGAFHGENGLGNVQLPLPKHIDEDKVIEAIDKAKDVDGFHPLNVAALWQKQPCTLPCTPKGIIKMLKAAGVGIAGKEAVVIGRSNIVGLPVSKLLLDENATVTMTHSRTRNLPEETRRADILVVAIGRPKFVTADMVRDGAVVIDVGVNRDPETGKLCGDVDFAAVEPKASVITPVPGGVGPMTICCLMENTIECFLRRMGRK